MTLREIIDTIINSDYDDWNRMTCWGGHTGPSYSQRLGVVTKGSGAWELEIEEHAHVAAYKPNASITVAWGFTHNDDFQENWHQNLPDKRASSSFIDVFFNGALVFRTIMVSVDGGRVYLPLPNAQTVNVPNGYARFVDVICSGSRNDRVFSDYFDRVGFQRVNDRWPEEV